MRGVGIGDLQRLILKRNAVAVRRAFHQQAVEPDIAALPTTAMGGVGAREARLAAQAAETGGEASSATGEAVAETESAEAAVSADGHPIAPAGTEAAAGEGGRRRRGRRGGRRRRRPDGTVAGDITGTEDASSSQSEIEFDDEEEAEGEESFETSSASPAASSEPVQASTFTVTSAESDFDDLPMTDAVASAPVQVVVAPLSVPSVSEVYALPVEHVALQPVVSMTVEPLPASPMNVRDEVPLISAEPESNVAWLPELEAAPIAEPAGLVEDELKDDESVADSDSGIRNTPAA